MSKLNQIIRAAGKLVTDNSPVILTSLAAAGVVTTAILTGKSAVQATDAIRNFEAKDNGLWVKTSPKEKLEISWKFFLPPIIVGTATVGCIIGAQSINSRRTAALAGLYSITETTLREYQDKVVEVIGEKKEQQIRDEVAQDRINRTEGSSEVIIVSGDSLCYDTITGRYFTSSVNKIERAEIAINRKLNEEMYASLNDFFQEIDLPITRLGEELGWSADHPLEIRFSSVLTPESKPCLSIEYRVAPKRDYYKLN